MNQKTLLRSITGILLIVLAASFIEAPSVKKFKPTGTWDYTLVGVPMEYETGVMIIEKADKGYGVSVGITEDEMVSCVDVVYEKKTLKFTLKMDYSSILFSGTFDKDTFSGTLNHSEGTFDMSATWRAKK